MMEVCAQKGPTVATQEMTNLKAEASLTAMDTGAMMGVTTDSTLKIVDTNNMKENSMTNILMKATVGAVLLIL